MLAKKILKYKEFLSAYEEVLSREKGKAEIHYYAKNASLLLGREKHFKARQ